MTKVLYLIPLLLTGCLSTGGSGDSSSVSSSHPGRQPPSNNQGSNSSSGNKNSLNTFIDTDKFEQNVTTANNNSIKQALSTAKISTTEKNISIATEALKQNLTDSTYISSKLTKLNDVVDYYNNNYLKKLESYNESQTNYEPVYYDGYTPRENEEPDDEFASRLLQVIGNKYVDYGTASSEGKYSEYINNSLYGWANDIKQALGKAENDPILDINKIQEQFYSLYTELKTIKSSIENDYSNAKQELLKKIQTVDPSVKEFPLSLENLMNYYQLEQSILDAIGSVDYINQSTPKTLNYTATSLYDTGNSKSVKFVYDADSKTYTLLLKDIRSGSTDREVRFNASDFVSQDNYYIASKAVNVGDSTVYKTYFNNLKDYISAGGNYDFEVSKRKNEAINIIKRVIYNQYPTQQDINFFNDWFGTTLSFDNFQQSDVSSCLSEAQLALSILNKTNSVFDILEVNKITDSVKLGGKPLKLSYSDFGLWTIKESTEYAGDKDLLAAKKDTEQNTYNYIDNPFFTGLDEFKAGFKSQPGSGINETEKFTGKTIAVASKGDIRNELNGTATLSIDKQDATGSVNLSFDKWYSFTFNDIDFSNTNGFSLKDTIVSVNNAVYNSDIKITATKDEIKGNITGALYGPDINTPTEGVGAYNIITGDDVKVNGAFGVKK